MHTALQLDQEALQCIRHNENTELALTCLAWETAKKRSGKHIVTLGPQNGLGQFSMAPNSDLPRSCPLF